MDNMLSPKECLYTKFDIDKRVYEITCAIANDYTDAEEELVLVGILKGSFIFLSDLSRRLRLPHTIDFISISSYGDSGSEQGEVKLVMDTNQNLSGKNVIIIEDIVDSGNTLKYVKEKYSSISSRIYIQYTCRWFDNITTPFWQPIIRNQLISSWKHSIIYLSKIQCLFRSWWIM